MAQIAVIGSGYVGLGTGVVFANLGHDVIGIDVDSTKVARLNAGECPIFEPGLEDLLRANLAAGRIRFTTDYPDGLDGADFAFVCVGTPMGVHGGADMRYVRSAARQIGANLPVGRRLIIVNKSTMPIGSGDMVGRLIQEVAADGTDFAVVSNPEFLREGSAVADMLNPDRVVLGSADLRAAETVSELYRPLAAPTVLTDLRTAEMIKYASNAFLATKISFINEMAQICESLGADVRQVAVGMGLDERIGSRFLDAGIGFGGSCFPKDVRALEYMAGEAHCHPQLLRAVLEINRDARRAFVRKIDLALDGLEGRTVAIWGLAFKPNTDDLREAPALEIIPELQSRGAVIRAHDPAAMAGARSLLNDVTFCDDPIEAARGADVVVVVTEWAQFRAVDLAALRSVMAQPTVIDGRNIFDPMAMAASGFTYRGIGIPQVTPVAQPLRLDDEAFAELSRMVAD